MQNRYAGDIGDYAKLALLRALSPGRQLGVAWYLFPDEGHNADGRHRSYLDAPERWRPLDPELFDCLRGLRDGEPSVGAIEHVDVLPGAVFSSELLASQHPGQAARRLWRERWFENVLDGLRGCDLVFADPDNGLCPDHRFRPGRRKSWKRLAISEARRLAEGRAAIFYHHNSRFTGGHEAEIDHWLGVLGERAMAIRWRPYSPRTFFILGADDAIEARTRQFHEQAKPFTTLHFAPH